ncbi:MAG: hypothetical protein N4A72_10350 [Bacteroidales bacterium]|jgi:hypothetical protein|nr:hypothetical protein [Bacteroidales bacterium]
MSGKRVLLHIGYPKTATTWFQKDLFPNVKDIKLFTDQRFVSSLRRADTADKQHVNDIINSVNEKTVVISNENILGSKNRVFTNPEHLAAIFQNAEIVLFVRNQIDKYRSNYSQYIKQGGVLSPEEYLFSQGQDLFGGEKHKYYRIINLYRDHFGKENVHIFFYEEFIENSQLFIADFARQLNLNVSGDIVNGRRRNVKLSDRDIKTVRSFNRFCNNILPKFMVRYLGAKQQYVIDRVLSGQGRKFVYGKRTNECIANYFRSDNRMLSAEFKQIEKYNYPL